MTIADKFILLGLVIGFAVGIGGWLIAKAVIGKLNDAETPPMERRKTPEQFRASGLSGLYSGPEKRRDVRDVWGGQV
jgi:divalent metal cation (Fe/Co/Zn/Cd) transporter